MVGIYKITNKINGKVYVGQSVNIEQRWKNHKKDAFWKDGPNYEYPLYRAIRKYGIDNFYFEVIEECPKDELNEKEIYYIAFYNANGACGYNQDAGGSARHNVKLTIDDVKQIIDKLRYTTDTYMQIGNSFGVHNKMIWAINNGENWSLDGEVYPIRKPKAPIKNLCPLCCSEIWKGSTFCKACRPKIDSLKQREKRPPVTELSKLVVENGFSATGKKFGVSDSAIKKWLRDYGIPYHKKELIDWYNCHLNIAPKETFHAPRIKKVKQIDCISGEVIAIFDNAKLAAESLGRKKGSHISEVCNGKHDMAYGYKWEFV